MAEYAEGGYVAAAIDCRYHGQRGGGGWDGYQQALVRWAAWPPGSRPPR
jgi:hypothetical protein